MNAYFGVSEQGGKEEKSFHFFAKILVYVIFFL